MSSAVRKPLPQPIQHVTARGQGRAPVLVDDTDHWSFVQLLGSVCTTHGWRCLSWCLTESCVQLVITGPPGRLDRGIEELAAAHANRQRSRHRSSGHLFQGPCTTMLLSPDAYLLEVVRHVLLAPVRAGRCRRAGDWRWSSAREALGLKPASPWADFSVVYALLGSGSLDGPARLARYLDSR